MELSFGCRCQVCAGPQAGGADSREGQQSSDGAHSAASSQTLWQVRPTAAAPAWSTQHQLASGGVFVSAPPSGGFALQLFTHRDAAHQTQLTCRLWNLWNTCVRGCYVSFGLQNVLLTLCSLFLSKGRSFFTASSGEVQQLKKHEPVSTNAGKYLPACITLCTSVHSTVLKTKTGTFFPVSIVWQM